MVSSFWGQQAGRGSGLPAVMFFKGRSGSADARVLTATFAVGGIAAVVQKFTCLFARGTLFGRCLRLHLISAIAALPTGHGISSFALRENKSWAAALCLALKWLPAPMMHRQTCTRCVHAHRTAVWFTPLSNDRAGCSTHAP